MWTWLLLWLWPMCCACALSVGYTLVRSFGGALLSLWPMCVVWGFDRLPRLVWAVGFHLCALHTYCDFCAMCGCTVGLRCHQSRHSALWVDVATPLFVLPFVPLVCPPWSTSAFTHGVLTTLTGHYIAPQLVLWDTIRSSHWQNEVKTE